MGVLDFVLELVGLGMLAVLLGFGLLLAGSLIAGMASVVSSFLRG